MIGLHVTCGLLTTLSNYLAEIPTLLKSWQPQRPSQCALPSRSRRALDRSAGLDRSPAPPAQVPAREALERVLGAAAERHLVGAEARARHGGVARAERDLPERAPREAPAVGQRGARTQGGGGYAPLALVAGVGALAAILARRRRRDAAPAAAEAPALV